jgi:hypothetical protein
VFIVSGAGSLAPPRRGGTPRVKTLSAPSRDSADLHLYIPSRQVAADVRAGSAEPIGARPQSHLRGNTMKRNVALMMIALVGSLAALACAGQVYAPQTVVSAHFPAGISADARIFYDDLRSLGSWVQVEGPGWVWYPRSVPAGWRPYVHGRWAYTDFGWTWDSEEEWGWAVYHYGRWHHTPRYGWVWVPGSEWGPAWVTWHSGGGWIGWAPLPWQVAWRAGVGLDWGRIDARVAIEPAWWCFLQMRHLTDPNPGQHFAAVTRNLALIKITKNVTSYTLVDNRVFNQGVAVNVISKAIGRAVPRLTVRHTDTPREAQRGKPERDVLKLFRPGLRRGQQPEGTPGHAKQSDPEPSGDPAGPDRAAQPTEEARDNQPVERPKSGRFQGLRERIRETREARSPEGRSDDRPADRSDDRHDERPADPPNDRPAERPEQGRAPESGGPPAAVPDEGGNRGHDAEHRPQGTGPERSPQPAAEQPPKREQDSKPQVSRPQASRPKPGKPSSRKPGKDGKESPKTDDPDSDKKGDSKSNDPEKEGSKPDDSGEEQP